MAPLRIDIRARIPSDTEIGRLAELLERGEVVILPTDTLYGLHALARDDRAVARLYEIKQRDSRKALPVLCSDINQVEQLGAILSPELRDILDEVWPGALTIVVRLNEPIAASAGESTLAIRVPALEWLRTLIEISGPIASTSVNRSGEKSLYSTEELTEEVASRVAAIVDAGILESEGSTIIDFVSAPPKLLRQGDFSFTQKLWKTVWKSLCKT